MLDRYANRQFNDLQVAHLFDLISNGIPAIILEVKFTSVTWRFPMNLLKETAIESIKRLPDGCTVEDIMYRINLIAQVYEGLKDADAGKLITTQELLERIDQWAS